MVFCAQKIFIYKYARQKDLSVVAFLRLLTEMNLAEV